MVLERPVDESTNLTTTHAVRTNCCLSGVTMSWSNTKEEQTPLKGEKFSPSHLLFGNVDFENLCNFSRAPRFRSDSHAPPWFIIDFHLILPSYGSKLATRGGHSPDFFSSPGNGESRGIFFTSRDSPGSLFLLYRSSVKSTILRISPNYCPKQWTIS